MSTTLPHLLLVDDSAAILAFERAALAAHYHLSTASDGRDALQKLPQLMPDAVLLDLSMPIMDGEQVLTAMLADPLLREIPVIIISSEQGRGATCVKNGARAYLPKPIREDELRAIVVKVLDQVATERRRGSLAVLPVSVADVHFALALDTVQMAVQLPATQPLPSGPSYLSTWFELHGAPVCILDAARRLGVVHALPVEDRMLVVVAHRGQTLAVCVDRVEDPEEIEPAAVKDPSALGGATLGLLPSTLVAVVRSSRGLLPVISAHALVSPALLARLSALVPPR